MLMNVVDPLLVDGYLLRSADRYPSRVALSDGIREVTYLKFDRDVNRLADALEGLGVQRGDRVALLMQNGIENAVSLLAVPRLGAMAAPVNNRLTPVEIGYILNDLEPAVVIVDAGFVSKLDDTTRSRASIVVVGGPSFGSTDSGVDAAALVGYETCLASGDARYKPREAHATGGAYILYTSGTTGRPKGAVLSHAGYVIGSLATLNVMRMADPKEIRHLGVPMFHSGGLNVLLQQVVLGGTTLISEPGGLPAAELVDLWERHGVATAFLTPTQWQQVCSVPRVEQRNLALKRIVWGASQPPPTVIERLHETFPGVPIFANFGMTETSGTTCSLQPEYASSKVDTVGRPAGHLQVRVVDGAMQDLPSGEIGEIVYQGPSVLREYWRNEKATAAAFEGGWFHSGDLGTFDSEGFLTVVGRLKELIVSGGENIYASEVEAAVSSHPKVAQVAVIGIPHPQWVETPRAIVVPTDSGQPPSLEELQEFIRPMLASYKKPTSLAIVETLPRNAMGKLMRTQLKVEQIDGDGVL